METLFRLLPGPQPALIRYGITALIVLAGFTLRISIGDSTGRYGFINFILPILAAALVFDRGAGFFAVLMSLALVASLLSWDGGIATHASAMLLFLVVGACLVFVAEGLRTALSKAHAAQEAADLLLQEMSHRVKNKFAMISSIIGLQARTSNPEVRQALEDVAARVNVMATVHDFLQFSRHDGLIDMSEYLPGLCKALREALCGPRPITMVVRAEPVQMTAATALPTGLIVNELVTNAFKYAFEAERPGQIQVQLRRLGQEVELSVTDNGRGYDANEQRTGLGTRLVTVFAAQLGGTASWSRCQDGGCKAAVHFPI